MSSKIFIAVISLGFIGVIIGLVVLQVTKLKNKKIEEEKTKALELVGEKKPLLPTGLPSPEPSPVAKIQITDAQDLIEQEDPDSPPSMNIDTSKKYSAILETTVGNITIQFTTSETPITVNNFITLARKNFFDDTIFHRVIKGFMIQGGDPRGDGTGGPGYKFNDETFFGEYTRGTVAMANSGPNTNGSQFFIMHEDSPSLPKNYVIFGEVIKGMDVVDEIANAPVTSSRSGEASRPVSPVSVVNVKIVEE